MTIYETTLIVREGPLLCPERCTEIARETVRGDDNEVWAAANAFIDRYCPGPYMKHKRVWDCTPWKVV